MIQMRRLSLTLIRGQLSTINWNCSAIDGNDRPRARGGAEVGILHTGRESACSKANEAETQAIGQCVYFMEMRVQMGLGKDL